MPLTRAQGEALDSLKEAVDVPVAFRNEDAYEIGEYIPIEEAAREVLTAFGLTLAVVKDEETE